MACISSVDLQTRLDVQELLSRWCHYLDHGQSQEWSRLFTLDSRVDAGPLGTFTGRDEIAQLPQRVADKGQGLWRHHLSNMMFERTGNLRELKVSAYCLTTDWSAGGALIQCSDFSAMLEYRCHWQIASMVTEPVGTMVTQNGIPSIAPSFATGACALPN